jgi:hypothetical protein
MKRTMLAAAFLALGAQGALAVDYRTSMESYLDTRIAGWAQDPVIVAAIRAQNALTADYDQPRIDALDAAWRDEVGTAQTPTIAPVLTGDAADFLRARVADAGGAITEIFIMDAQGLNVAASSVTSDYWQGDEAKFRMTYPEGADAMHFSEIEFDESSQSYQAQISLTISDPKTGEPIGAMTVGVMADALM